MVVIVQNEMTYFLIYYTKRNMKESKKEIRWPLFSCVSELGVESITMPAEQSVSSAKHPEILVSIISLTLMKFCL